MTHHSEENQRRREQDRKARELNMRLRELEAEIQEVTAAHVAIIDSVSHHESIHVQPNSKRTVRRWGQNLINLGKFLVLVIVVMTAIRVATWLATAIIVGTIAFTGYQLFFCDNDQHGTR
jgi:transcriptional regulator of heat shock response